MKSRVGVQGKGDEMSDEERAIARRMDRGIVDEMYEDGEYDEFTSFAEGMEGYEVRHLAKHGVRFEW